MLTQTQRLSHEQRPLTTAHLAQTMTLLQLSGDELGQTIESELAKNPALELVDNRRCPTCQRVLTGKKGCPVCNFKPNGSQDAPIVFVSSQNDFVFSPDSTPKNDYPSDFYPAGEEDLSEYVLRQIAPEINPKDRKLAIHILTSLDDDGLLPIPLFEISRYHHVPLSEVRKIQRLIQTSDPIGVASSSPHEALLVQLEILEESKHIPSLSKRIIEQGMNLLSKHAYNELSRMLGAPVRVVIEAANFITDNLNPYPARSHWGKGRQNPQQNAAYLQPDIIISKSRNKNSDRLVVEIIAPYSGSIRINPLFRKAMQNAPQEKNGQWQSDMYRASLLIKCLQQRNNTLVRLMQIIVSMQKNYILNGDVHLKPMTRADLATKLGVHESTISRAVSSKSIQLPNKRIIPFSLMFDRSLPVRATIRDMIASEESPLSDSQISSNLKDLGMPVARRTVAKYRAMEGILPARMRANPDPISE